MVRSTKRATSSDPATTIRKLEGLESVLATVDDLFREREGSSVWSSRVQQTIERKRPNFSETYHGYRNFNDSSKTPARGLAKIQKDEWSGGYLITELGPTS